MGPNVIEWKLPLIFYRFLLRPSLSYPSFFIGSRRTKHYRSDHTQTSQNPTILYYHERKKSSLDDTTPLLDEEEEEEEDTPDHLEDRVMSRWCLN